MINNLFKHFNNSSTFFSFFLNESDGKVVKECKKSKIGTLLGRMSKIGTFLGFRQIAPKAKNNSKCYTIKLPFK